MSCTTGALQREPCSHSSKGAPSPAGLKTITMSGFQKREKPATKKRFQTSRHRRRRCSLKVTRLRSLSGQVWNNFRRTDRCELREDGSPVLVLVRTVTVDPRDTSRLTTSAQTISYPPIASGG